MHKVPLPIRFGKPHRRVLYAVFVGLWGAGLLWLVFHYFFGVQGDFGPTPHPLEKWWLRAHGLFAFAALIALGSVLPVHARGAWERKRNRRTGVAMKFWMLWLAATGYTLYYFSSESNESWLPMLHWAAGLALPLMLVWHVRRGRSRAAPRVAPRPDRSPTPHVAAQRSPHAAFKKSCNVLPGTD